MCNCKGYNFVIDENIIKILNMEIAGFDSLPSICFLGIIFVFIFSRVSWMAIVKSLHLLIAINKFYYGFRGCKLFIYQIYWQMYNSVYLLRLLMLCYFPCNAECLFDLWMFKHKVCIFFMFYYLRPE